MIRTRYAALLAVALGFAACSDSGVTPPEPTIDSIVVDPDATSVTAVGATVQFTAEAFTSEGTPFAGVTFAWSSSDPAVASVDAAGLATAVDFGETLITATAEGVSAQALLSVRDCQEAVTLAPGAWTAQAVPADDECGVVLPAGAAGDRYRVALIRTSPADSNSLDRPDVSVQVTPLGAANASLLATPARVEAPLGQSRRLPHVPGLAEAAALAERTSRAHQRLARQASALRDRMGPEHVLPPTPAGISAALAQDLPATIQAYTAFNRDCSAANAGERSTAVLIWQNEDFAFYQVQEQRDSGPAPTSTQVQRMAQFVDDYGWDVIDTYFGGVPDTDGNGKVIVIVTPEADSFAAYVWSGDYFAASGDGRCVGSNEGEYIYFNAGIITGQDDGNWQSLEALVHELKHNSSMYNSVSPDRARPFYHPSWEEEGSAEIAGNMASRVGWAGVGGPTPNATLVSDDIYRAGFELPDGEGAIRPEFYGVLLRLYRTHEYLTSQPNGLFVTPQGEGVSDDASIYGSGWTFLRWLGDAYGDAASGPLADAPLFEALNAVATPPGPTGLEAVTGTPMRRLMEEYAAAIMRNGTVVAAGPKAFTSYDFVSAIEDFCFAADNPPCQGSPSGPNGAWPWSATTGSDGTPSRSLQEAATYTGPIGGGGIRVHDLVSNGTGTGAELRVTGAPSGTRVVILRIQ